MSGDEVGEFEGRPFFADAVRLRKWDDAAKVVGLNTPPLDHYGVYVGRVSRVTMP
jgi:predicted HD phosphohydrolase